MLLRSQNEQLLVLLELLLEQVVSIVAANFGNLLSLRLIMDRLGRCGVLAGDGELLGADAVSTGHQARCRVESGLL